MSNSLWPYGLSMEFSRQESWSGVPFPSPGHLFHPEIKPTSLVRVSCIGRRIFFTTVPLGNWLWVKKNSLDPLGECSSCENVASNMWKICRRASSDNSGQYIFSFSFLTWARALVSQLKPNQTSGRFTGAQAPLRLIMEPQAPFLLPCSPHLHGSKLSKVLLWYR